MSRRHGSEHKNRRSGWPQSTPNFRTDPTEGHHSLGYHAEDLIFRMSLPQSTFSPQQAINPTRTSGRHRNRPSPTDFQSPTPDSSPSLGELYPNAALFSDGSVSGVQNSTTSPGSEGFAPFQPQHHPMFPQQPPRRRPPPHPNPQPQRVLTAADFLHRRPLSPQPSSSESSGHSRQSSVGSFTHLPPPFPLPAPSTQPIAIPQVNSHTNSHANFPFTPQHHPASRRRRRPRKNTDIPFPAPSNRPHPDSSNGGQGPSSSC